MSEHSGFIDGALGPALAGTFLMGLARAHQGFVFDWNVLHKGGINTAQRVAPGILVESTFALLFYAVGTIPLAVAIDKVDCSVLQVYFLVSSVTLLLCKPLSEVMRKRVADAGGPQARLEPGTVALRAIVMVAFGLYLLMLALAGAEIGKDKPGAISDAATGATTGLVLAELISPFVLYMPRREWLWAAHACRAVSTFAWTVLAFCLAYRDHD